MVRHILCVDRLISTLLLQPLMGRTSGTLIHSTSSQQMRQLSPQESHEEALSRAKETSCPNAPSLASLLLLVDECCVVYVGERCCSYQVPYSEREKGYGFTFKDEPPLPVSIKSSSPHAQVPSTCR